MYLAYLPSILKTIYREIIGRFGNQCMQYLHGRALAEREGATLLTSRWIGEEIFDLPAPLLKGESVDSQVVTGYAQDQASMIYTKRQAQEWLTLKPDMVALLWNLNSFAKHFRADIACHLRRGDYFQCGYPVCSQESYDRLIASFPVEKTDKLVLFIQDRTFNLEGVPDFLPDFYVLMTARVLIRANSSFSWVAGLLSHSKVYSPIIDGLEGGREHDVKFVEGNHPRLANFDFTTDLHVDP